MTSGSASGLLILGVALGAFVAVRFYFGMSYTAGARTPRRVSRKDDPFSFWTQIGPMAAAALILIAAGLYGLIRG